MPSGTARAGTARGLQRVPARNHEEPRSTPPKRRRRRKIKYQLFSLGEGLDMPLFVFIMVLLAIGLPHEIAHGSLRLTVSWENTMEEMDRTVEAVKEIVERLRNMSPLYEDFIRSAGQNR